MLFSDFYNQDISGKCKVSVSAKQGSAFAKDVANDFNPLHDAQSRRFCVPGDLLFAISLNEFGLYQNMKFEFLNLVDAGQLIQFSEKTDLTLMAKNDAGRDVLKVSRSGNKIPAGDQVTDFILQYVLFSGQNFLQIIMPLMEQHKVMINPQRPMVVYQQMQFSLTSLHCQKLTLLETSLEHQGRRGEVVLNFAFHDGETIIGHGSKRLLLSGLRAWEQHACSALAQEYRDRRDAWLASK